MTIQLDTQGNYARHGTDRITIQGNGGVDPIVFTGAVLKAHATDSTQWFIKIETGAGTIKDAATYEDGVVRCVLKRNGLLVEGDGYIQLQAEYDGKTWQTAKIPCTIGGTIPADELAEEQQLPYLQEVDAKIGVITGMTAQAETLTPGSAATAAWDGDKGVLTIGVPTGPQGPKGETGEQGPTGPQGETGPAGPPGADAPQEAVLYTPQELTSEQMAVARVNIGAGEAEGVYELIETITLDDGITALSRTGMNLKKMHIVGVWPQTSETVNANIWIDSNLRSISYFYGTIGNTEGVLYTTLDMTIAAEQVRAMWKSVLYGTVYGVNNQEVLILAKDGETIKSIWIGAGKGLTAGATIEIWGVRANA